MEERQTDLVFLYMYMYRFSLSIHVYVQIQSFYTCISINLSKSIAMEERYLSTYRQGFRIQGLRVQDLGFRIQGLGFRVQAYLSYRQGFSVICLHTEGKGFWGFRVQGLGFSVHSCLGFRVQGFRGLGFRVICLHAQNRPPLSILSSDLDLDLTPKH